MVTAVVLSHRHTSNTVAIRDMNYLMEKLKSENLHSFRLLLVLLVLRIRTISLYRWAMLKGYVTAKPGTGLIACVKSNARVLTSSSYQRTHCV